MAPEYTYAKGTKVPPDTSAGDVMKYLAMMGANRVQTEFDPDTQEPVGMRFIIKCPTTGNDLHYKMPIRWEQVAEKWKAEKKDKARQRLPEGWEEKVEKQALWCSWRIALEWLKIQVSFVKCGARDLKEVFMSDMIVNAEGATLGELMLEGKLPKLIEAPKD